MSQGICCLTCRKYIMKHQDGCRCESPRFTADLKTEIDIDDAIRIAERDPQQGDAEYMRETFEVIEEVDE